MKLSDNAVFRGLQNRRSGVRDPPPLPVKFATSSLLLNCLSALGCSEEHLGELVTLALHPPLSASVIRPSQTYVHLSSIRASGAEFH